MTLSAARIDQSDSISTATPPATNVVRILVEPCETWENMATIANIATMFWQELDPTTDRYSAWIIVFLNFTLISHYCHSNEKRAKNENVSTMSKYCAYIVLTLEENILIISLQYLQMIENCTKMSFRGD